MLPVVALALTPAAMVATLAIVSHPIALSVAIVIVGAVILRPPYGPDLSYLDRPRPARVVIGRPIRRPMPIRFLPPVDDRTGLVDVATVAHAHTPEGLATEIDRLIACYHRACQSRHRTRAAAYADRIAHLSSLARA